VYCLEEVCNGKEDRSDTQKSFAQKSTVAKGYETRPDVGSNTPTSNYANRAARNEPKQGYRFITAIYMSAGLIQFIIYGSFTYKVGTSIEKNIGFLRMAIIYFLTGIGANIFAGNLAPYAVMMGQGGVSMGLLSCMIVDLLQFWPIVPKCYHELAQLLGTVAVTFIIGLLPSLDNFQHLGGFLFGIPCALIMLPFLTFGKWDHARKRAIFALAFPCLLIAFVVTTVTFYSVQNQADESGFNCLKFEGDYMCSNTYEDGD
jgi:membrane associated rhomboid family serine protease